MARVPSHLKGARVSVVSIWFQFGHQTFTKAPVCASLRCSVRGQLQGWLYHPSLPRLFNSLFSPQDLDMIHGPVSFPRTVESARASDLLLPPVFQLRTHFPGMGLAEHRCYPETSFLRLGMKPTTVSSQCLLRGRPPWLPHRALWASVTLAHSLLHLRLLLYVLHRQF